MTFLINGAVFTGHVKDYSSSIEEKVEILFSNPYRYYIDPFVWTMRGSSRIEELRTLHNQAYESKKYHLCLRIEDVIEYLNTIYKLEPDTLKIKRVPFRHRITFKLKKLFNFTKTFKKQYRNKI